ncbi:MAG TPA: L,D-transpeptidase [Acidimicrobiales bacterium]|nr:L,D-transpeptidase [Acidimicrobiales bacterium]
MSRTPHPLARLLAPLLLAVALLLGACGGSPAPTADPAPVTTAVPAPPTIAVPEDTEDTDGETVAVATAPDVALVARPTTAVTVTTIPGGDVIATLEPVTELGSARALLVVDRTDDWLQVALPVRPNGATGWIPAAGIELREVDLEVVVDLGARTLTLTDAGEVVLTTPVAIGTDDTPTPTGRFYITDKVDTGAPAGPYGPYALGLSAHSDVLDQFAGGPGQIGIHGTDEPDSIGTAASHGCIRLPNDVIVALTELVPLGTPVVIV